MILCRRELNEIKYQIWLWHQYDSMPRTFADIDLVFLLLSLFLYFWSSIFFSFFLCFPTCWSLVPPDIGGLLRGSQLRHSLSGPDVPSTDWQKPRAYDVWSSSRRWVGRMMLRMRLKYLEGVVRKQYHKIFLDASEKDGSFHRWRIILSWRRIFHTLTRFLTGSTIGDE